MILKFLKQQIQRKSLKISVLLMILLFSGLKNNAESVAKFTISGYVKDASNGEMLLGVTVRVAGTGTGTTTNQFGFYSLSLIPDEYNLVYSFVGYKSDTVSVNLRNHLKKDIELESYSENLQEVEITAKRGNENIRNPEMSIVKVGIKQINRMPALLGEVDIIKAIQLLPGVQATSEGSSGFSVRGGNPDQNLILLDEAVVYNVSHLMGFFSVFNNDAIKDVTLYKGDIPAAYGGRLSSLLDVRMKDGNSKHFAAKGSIGTVSSKLTLEGPVVRDKTMYMISGRHTYADLFLPFAKNKDLHGNRLYFYDLNLKLSHILNENNRFYISVYKGRDVFNNKFARMSYGNSTFSARWNHLFSKKLFMNSSVIYSKYDYSLGMPDENPSSFSWISGLMDVSGRVDFSYFLNTENTLKFGVQSTYHEFEPGVIEGKQNENDFLSFALPKMYALESGLFALNEQKAEKFTLKYGLRFSLFQNLGKATVFQYDSLYHVTDSLYYKKGDIYNHYNGFEPRIAVNYEIDKVSSVKISFSKTFQYMSLAQNSTSGTPLDIWFSSSPNVKPQKSDLIAAGYFRNYHDGDIETSVEVYYKRIHNVIDFRDHAILFLNEKLEGELRVGTGHAYGIETLIRKNTGKLTGWVSYTYSRSFREIKEISENAYPAPYDKPHSVAIVLSYDISKHWIASANWTYATGLPATFPTGRAVIGGKIIPVYSDRNAYRMPDYHRLDFSVTYKGKEGKKWQSEWNLSVYNVYNRKNVWSINFVTDESDPSVTYAEKTYLFSIIPAITYNFYFNK